MTERSLQHLGYGLLGSIAATYSEGSTKSLSEKIGDGRRNTAELRAPSRSRCPKTCSQSCAPSTSMSQLELDVRDAIDRSDVSGPERPTLEAIAEILQQARRSRSVSVEERTIIVLESKRLRRRS